MVRVLLPPLLVAVSIAAAFVLTEERQVAAFLAVGILPLLLTAESLVAEWRVRTTPRVVAAVAGFAFVVWVIPAALMSWFVPLAAWLLAVAIVYGLARTPMRQRRVGLAWVQASDAFDRRRTTLGRHYRWRVMLAATPWMIHGLSLSLMIIGVTMYAASTLGLTSGSPETAVIGALFGTLALGMALLVALGSVFLLAGLGLAPLFRVPYLRLLRGLLGEGEAVVSRGGCAFGLGLTVLDVLLLGVGFVWAGSTFIGSAFPGGGSTASTMLLPLVVVAVWARVGVGDAQLVAEQSDRTLVGVLVAAVRDIDALLPLTVFQLGVVLWLFVVPSLAIAIGLLGALAALEAHPAWLAIGGGVSVVVLGRLWAATVLRLNLQRLIWLRGEARERQEDGPGHGDVRSRAGL